MHIKLPLPIYRLLKATSFWRNHSQILREFKYFRGTTALAIGFSLLAAIFEGFTVGSVSVLLRSLTNPDQPVFQTGVSWFDIWFLGINASASSRLYRVTALILFLVWLRSSFLYLGAFYTGLSQLLLTDRLRKRVFEQLQSLSLSFFAKKRPGDLINSIRGEVQQIGLACSVASIVIAKGSTVIVYVISLFWLSWQLTTISILMLILLTTGISTLRKKVREASFESVTAAKNLTSVSMEFINGVRTVQSFMTQDFERQRFYKASNQVVKAGNKSRAAMALVQPLTQGVSTTILLVMLVVASTTLVANGTLQVASLLTFLFILLRLGPIVSRLNGAWSQLDSFEGSANNVKQLLRTDNKPYLPNGKLQFLGLQQAIEFVGVDFSYDNKNLVLKNINLTIPRGKMTALVGASGAGKSTLVDLIPRFYDPTNGQILVDGIDLCRIDVGYLRRKMAIVSQDTFIFNTSAWNNIAYGTEDAEEAAIWEAARLANALEFILELPKGFETQLGNRGVRLSGGQRQRIAIARALLRNPEILILDEATSALDSVSERLIQESIEQLSVGRTTIAIAHRLSTIVRADQVIVLERGRIVEQGRYQELLEQHGKLWQYHQMQH
ncbi:ABC transporter ATP-binding protein [Pleurocapsales cyanobacterium LEGE 10410]|nr:ABC transporter ATP-binding protein [Pleurocapsales cyanobacterium LEGE 10410]